MESDLAIFQWMFGQFDVVMNSYISAKVSAVIAAIGPTAWTMFGIYVIFWGFAMIRGLIDESVTDGLFRLLRVSVVMGFALNVGIYQTNVVDFFMQTPDAMADVLGFGGNAESGGQSTFATLDKLMNKTIDASTDAYNQMSAFSPGQSVALAVSSYAILGFGMFFTLVAGIMIVLSKVLLVILLAIGPMFIIMALFSTTQRFFEAWLGQVITAMLTIVLILAVCSFFFGVVDEAVGKASGIVETNPIQAVTIIGIACVATTVFLFNVPGFASQLGGGISLPVKDAAKRLSGTSSGGAVASAAQNAMARKVVSVAAAKATGGASIAASTAGQLFRATNTIRRG